MLLRIFLFACSLFVLTAQVSAQSLLHEETMRPAEERHKTIQLAQEDVQKQKPQDGDVAQPATSQTEPNGKSTNEPENKNDNATNDAAAQQSTNTNNQAPAKPAIPADIQVLLTPADELVQRIETLEKKVDRLQDRDEVLVKQQPEVEELIDQADAIISDLDPKLDDVASQLKKLGPAPDGKDVPEEASDIAAERARLLTLNQTIDAAIKKSELTRVRAKQLIGRIQSARQDIFTRNLFERTKSPLWPSTWLDVIEALPRAGEQVDFILGNWWAKAQQSKSLILGLLALTVLVFWLLRRFLSAIIYYNLPKQPNPPPTFFRRALTASWVSVARALPSVAAASLLYFGLNEFELIESRLAFLASQLYLGFVVYTMASALARAYLQPRRPNWRLIDITSPTAKRIAWIIKAIAGLYAVDIVLRAAIQTLFLPLPVSIAEAFLVSIGFAALLFAIVRTRFTSETASEPVPLSYPKVLKVPLIGVAIFVVLSSLLGYIALGRFVAGQVVVTGSVLLLLLLFYLAIQAIAKPSAETAEDGITPGHLLGSAFGFDETQRGYANWIIAGLLNIALLLLALPLLLLSLGFAGHEIFSYGRSLLFGFDIAGVHISPARILIAIALFVGLMFVTRFIQRALSSRITKYRQADRGLANSIKTGVGYLGFIIASLAAVSYIGLDITNLAIVAGALSVGIGFGLQSIVNNFVSGLILLVERPIKVGDLIEASGQRGHVRRISVRSTEIETFDRASVIVPNSELISSSVINLTHQNALGRLLIPIGVSYDSDPEQVRAILERVAKNCDLILPYPEPSVSFDEFGASSLDFSLRAYVSDVNKSLSAKTELRTQIFNAFKAAGIEIPFPQQDVHLRDLDGVKQILAQAMANRARQAAEAAMSQSPSEPENDKKPEPPVENVQPAKPADDAAAQTPSKKRTIDPLNKERDEASFDSSDE